MITKEILQDWMSENNGYILYDQLHNGVFTGYVMFTPERAKSALENNTQNRKLGLKSQVPSLREAIKNGLWDDNVSKINFDKNGVLSDGQNRLWACVYENLPIRTLVTWGVDESTQLSTDRRGTRTLSDDLEIRGVKSANKIAAITRILYQRDEGFTVKQILVRGTGIRQRSTVDAMLLNYYMKNVDRITYVSKLTERVRSSVYELHINSEVLNILVNEFNNVNPDDAKCFWERLSTGYTTIENDPVTALRKRFIRTADKNKETINKDVQAALIIKAWNCFEKGITVQTLKFASGGAYPEQFPEIYNPYLDGDS